MAGQDARPAAARRAFASARASGGQAAALTLSKLGVRDRTRAVLKAFELQLVESIPVSPLPESPAGLLGWPVCAAACRDTAFPEIPE